MCLSLIAYSQPDTENDSKKVVILSEKVAKEVWKDIERLNRSDSISALNLIEIEKLINQTRVQDNVILGQQEQLSNWERIAVNKDSVINIGDKQTVFWKKKYKREKRILIGIAGISLFITVLALVGG